ncbi:unnamed protein product [Camellia sinensis]
MDMETEKENRIAAILMKEAAELDDKLRRVVCMFILGSPMLGVSRIHVFLIVTVLGVQQG